MGNPKLKKKKTETLKLNKTKPELILKDEEDKRSKKSTVNKKRKREKGTRVEIASLEGDKVEKGKGKKKEKTRKKRKNEEKISALEPQQLGSDTEDSHQEEIDEGVTHPRKIIEIESPEDANNGKKIKTRKSKKATKKKKKEADSVKEDQKLTENNKEEDEDVHYLSSGDEDCSKGMKKWVTNYYQSRPGLKVLQDRIDDFMTSHEERLEQEKEEKEAKAAEGGWTVVLHHKGRKKTTESETGVTVGSVSQAALEDKVARKKGQEGLQDFYRFQKREAHRNEIMTLQSKFEQDKKRIQQLRAERKFKPY